MRWWIYKKERFPIIAHGLLIAAFSSCAVAYSSLLGNQARPTLQAFIVAFITCFLFFLQLRIADEFKDAEEDAEFRPYRPVPRGLVTLKELGVVFILSAILQLALACWLFPKLIIVLSIAWAYLLLMSKEFFVREWIKSKPITYLWTHMLIMPIVDFYATSCHWMPSEEKPGFGLLTFLAASFCNGLIIEIGRKLRQPAQEENGVPTYSKLWGPKKAALIWWILLCITAALGALCAKQIHFLTIPLLLFSAFVVAGFIAMRRFQTRGMQGKTIETITGLWTLILYLAIGLIPLVIR